MRPGSSPRGRGKQRRRPRRPQRAGLIPAWAGKTETSRSSGPGIWAHPRVGGENPSSERLEARGAGSSPRGRGKHLACVEDDFIVRLIPAWAGKTARRADHRSRRPAHPRVGGENGVEPPDVCEGHGSSPRGRGKHEVRLACLRVDRLIPAWAGKTSSFSLLAGAVRAHPRVGGEN